MESDEELIERANGGQAEAFERLYHRHRDWVYHLAWRFTGNPQDALDVVQETFVYLLKKFPGFRLTASMTTFLYPVVKHLSLNVRRRRAARPLDEVAFDEIPAPEPPESSRAELAAAMASLSSEQREVVLMRFVDGMSLEEIAASLDIPLGTAKSRLHNALRKLRDDPRTREYFLE
ncbi:MAG: RNA polymerase sigma factor [Sedimentisphaerales bacterium]|nr:RNA polymerase sigma factor [Sedimentisphaerales bacterium]